MGGNVVESLGRFIFPSFFSTWIVPEAMLNKETIPSSLLVFDRRVESFWGEVETAGAKRPQ